MIDSILKHYHIIDTNIDLHSKSPKSPDILCFCEQHTEKSHQVKSGRLINEFYQKGDVILLEGAECELSERQRAHAVRTYDLPKDAIIKGWDKDDDEGFQILDKLKTLYQMMLKLQKLSCTSEEFMNGLKDITKFSPVELSKEENDLLNRTFIYTTTEVHNLVRQILKKSSSKLTTRLMDLEKNGESLLYRNTNMAKIISQNKTGTNKIHMICGAGHAFASKGLDKNSRKAINVMRYVLEKHRYVILYPNEEPVEKKSSNHSNCFIAFLCKVARFITQLFYKLFYCLSPSKEKIELVYAGEKTKWVEGEVLEGIGELLFNWGRRCPCAQQDNLS
jgi:hypothetical protein